LNERGDGMPSASVHLTSRQAEVLRLAAKGLVAKEIAHSLGISVRTVEGHLSEMRRVTGAKNMAELIAWGVTTGVILTGSAVLGHR